MGKLSKARNLKQRTKLTAGHFAEVDELGVRLARVAGGVVAVLVALAQPRVVVGRETVGRQSTRLHARLERQVFPVQLRTARDVKALVHGDYLHCTVNKQCTLCSLRRLVAQRVELTIDRS